MASRYDLDESLYDVDDGEDAYIGLDAHVHNADEDDDEDDGDYINEDGDDDAEDEEQEMDEDVYEDGTLELELNEEEGQILRSLLQDRIQPFVMSEDSVSSDQNTMLQNILALLRSTTQSQEDEVEERQERTARATRRQDESNFKSQTRQQEKNWIETWWKKPHKDPQPAGAALLDSGEFGYIGRSQRGGKNIPQILRERRSTYHPRYRQDLCENLVPNSAGTVVANYPASVYCGQYSADASFYYVCCKDFNLHIYDMTAAPTRRGNPILQPYDGDSGHQTTMKVHKSIQGFPGGWTITDSHLSPNNDRMIYSSMSPVVHMVKTLDDDVNEVPIDFADRHRGRARLGWDWNEDTVIWSCRFSADGNEIVAGGRGKIFVYDLMANKRTVKIEAHDDDVNSCCWADQGANVLISASDDSFLKVWDRRALGSSARPSGVLIGHTEGITNVSAKGDGRYVISNGKDQALRLWDLRKMASEESYDKVKHIHYGLHNFDYRYADKRPQKRMANPEDCSVMTYRGHTVMRTLIRCHFSPAETTGSRYIYSGSTDGRIHIWSLDGTLVQVLNRAETMPISFDPSGPEYPTTQHHNSFPCVRDVSWSSQEPVMLSAAWGPNGTSSVARHEWKGISKMAGRLEDWATKRLEESEEVRSSSSRDWRGWMRFPGSWEAPDYSDDDDE